MAAKPNRWQGGKGGPKGPGKSNNKGQLVEKTRAAIEAVPLASHAGSGSHATEGPAETALDLFGQEAERIAKLLAGIPTSQLYRFFEQVQTIRQRLEHDNTLPLEAIKAELALLRAKAAYRIARQGYSSGGGSDATELVRFFARHTNDLSDHKSFRDFVRHFEAIMAFHYVYARERDL